MNSEEKTKRMKVYCTIKNYALLVDSMNWVVCKLNTSNSGKSERVYDEIIPTSMSYHSNLENCLKWASMEILKDQLNKSEVLELNELVSLIKNHINEFDNLMVKK